jgi:hypothetical protein
VPIGARLDFTSKEVINLAVWAINIKSSCSKCGTVGYVIWVRSETKPIIGETSLVNWVRKMEGILYEENIDLTIPTPKNGGE